MMPTQKPELPPLKTPKSFTFPSEIQDDPKALSIEIKQEDYSSSGSESSIPTPLAYTEFLSALTPVFESPKGSTASFPRFTFEKSGPSPISQPSTATSPAFSSAPSLKSPSLKSPSVSLPPPSPCNVKSPKNPPALRRLRIPQSLKTPSMKDSPRTGTPLSANPFSAIPYSASPYTATPRSATSNFWASSPRDWQLQGLEPRSATTPKAVSVRHVVTRTVTYKRTPLDPPPKGKGKRRKTQECKEA